MLRVLLGPEIKELIEQKDWKTLKKVLKYWTAPDIVELMEDLKEDEMVILFRLLPRDLGADVFSELDTEKQKILIENLTNEKIREIISELSPDDRTDLFEELPGNITRKILNLLPSDIRRESLELLGYPEDTVGRLMTPDYVAIRPHWTVGRALKHVRKFGKKAETIDIIYVVDKDWHLLDDIPLKDLILTDSRKKVESIMDRHVVSISAFADQEEAIRLIEKYNLIALPVVDSDNVLLGIVTFDDIMDVLEEEVTEDIHKGSGIIPLEMSYSSAPVWYLYKKRIVWLFLLALAGFLSASVIAAFEKTLSSVVALAFFIPILTGSGGNTAAQAASLVIRAIAVGDLNIEKWFKIIRRELIHGLLIGFSLGVILYMLSYFLQKDITVSLVVGSSMVIIALWANLIGSLLPIILTKLKIDPAVVSNPLISTLVDATGLLVYFSVAKILLGLSF